MLTTALTRLRRSTPAALLLARREARLLTILLAVFAALWVFGIIADEVAEDETHTFDSQILLFFRDPLTQDPVGPPWIAQVATDITALGGFTVLTLVTLLVIGYLGLSRRWGAAALVLVSIGGGMLISHGLKLVFQRARPDLVPHLVDVHTLSFPSGHSTLAAVTYLTLGALLAAVQPSRRLKVFIMASALVIALLVGLSRVFLGVHWPTDVAAGWIIGAAWALLCRAVAEVLMRRRTIRDSGPETD
ncbi:phosphatase PAP2 family protein [Caenispirillum bisanense]|uniref:phosphatase PAP2 family protein n=1 Tax=Caenispirillum bisanense TaxID=414052 RepID=UPI0031D8E42A